MRKALVCFFLISCIFLNGCYSYKDINNVVFVTAVIFDINKEGQPVIYLEIFKPAKSASKSSEKAQRIVLKGTGKTAFEALNDINLSSSYTIDYTQNKAIIYTKRAAEYGINNFLDIFRRDIHFVIRPELAVYIGDVERIAKGSFQEEQYVGLFLWDLIMNIGQSSRTVESDISDYLTRRTGTSKSTVLTVIKVAEDQPQETLIVEGGAIIKQDKMVDLLPKEFGEAYNFLINNVKTGAMEVVSPNNKKKYISLRIEKSRTATKVNYDGKNVNVKKIINVNASIIETQNFINLSDEEIMQIQKGAEENLISLCTNVFNEYKKKNADIFKISDEVERKYGEGKIKDEKNIIKHTQLEIEPHVFINNCGKVRNYN